MAGATWTVPGYVIEQLLGAGGSGQVWRARSAATGEPVALKRLRGCGLEQLQAARAEAALLATLDHPNLVRLHEVVPTADGLVLVLDLAAGGSLADLVRARGRLTPGEVIAALAPIGAAVAYVHTSGIVHGDVTPANVVFTDIGLPLLADLGVARIAGEQAEVHTTPAFVDPTVAAGHLPGPHSDVFMLGGVALHALTGTVVWPGTSPAQVLAAAAAGEPGDVRARLAEAGVPAEVAAVVCRALEPDPRLRGSAAEFALELRHAGQPRAVELAAGRARVPPRPAEAARGGRHAARPLPPRESGVPRRAGRPRRPGLPRIPGRPRRPEPAPARPPVLPPAAAASSSLPLTHGVRARPVALRPPHVPWYRRRWLRPLLAGGAAVLLGSAAWLWWLRPDHAPQAGAPLPTASAPLPTASAAATAGPGQPPDPQPSTRSTTAAPRAAAGPAATATATLRRLDAIRAEAFARRAPDLLAQVYGDASLRAQDTALLTRIVPAGCGLQGVRTSFDHVVIAASSATMLHLTAVARLAPSTLVCDGSTAGQAPGAGPVTLHISLRRSSGDYLIVAQTAT